jgi:hypothetical protein
MSIPDPLERGRQSPDAPAQDAIDHFWGALHEMLGAARAVLDAADAVVEQQRSGRRSSTPGPRVRHIDVDES